MQRTVTSSIVPMDHDQLFRHYYPYVKAMVIRHKVPEEHHEDVAMTLLTKFIEKGLLEQFDPERVGVNGRPVQFASFLSGFVYAYIRHYVERLALDAQKYQTFIDTSDTPTETDSGVPWMDAMGFSHEDDTTTVEYEFAVRRIRDHLDTIEVHRKKDFRLLFDLIIFQLEEHERVNKRELAHLFDVSEPLVASWIKQLARHIQPLYS